LERSWRLVATGVSFAVFAVCSVLASAALFPVLALVAADRVRRRRWARAVNRVSFRALLRFMTLAGVATFDIDREGLARLGADGGGMVVANHPTFLDVVVLLAYIEQANCVVKHSLWRNPFLAAPMRVAGYIPNLNPEQVLRDCAQALARNETLIVFPEATRSVPGEALRLQRGAANIALAADTWLKIVHFECEPVLLAGGMPWYRVPKRRPCLAASVGASVRARDFLHTGEHRSVAARRLTQALQRELSKGVQPDASAGTGAQTAPH
jgi:1-acyl-sn-glycerol-3-phosphate acyltransferase